MDVLYSFLISCNGIEDIYNTFVSQFLVDLRLHGIDEVIVQPVSDAIIRKKYAKWTSVQLSLGRTS